ncbi:MAG: hypothetical protein AB7D96_02245 [Arcobacteraceae bacterium]
MKKITINEKFITIDSSKNSFVSTQLLVPFLSWLKGKPIKYIRVDDVDDAKKEPLFVFEDSKIVFESTPLHLKDGIELSMQMTEKAEAVFNASSKIVQSIGENEDFNNVFWFIVIDYPTKENATRAFEVYKSIYKIYENIDNYKPAIMFILNDCNIDNKTVAELEMEFCYIFGNSWMDLDFILKENIPANDFNFIIFPASTYYLNLSTAYKKLFVELDSIIPDLRGRELLYTQFISLYLFVEKYRDRVNSP